ncbi:MAG TPA: hypothetical protein VGH66_05775 [Acidimicrobiales bacterium]|jgi:hypothetical protein
MLVLTLGSLTLDLMDVSNGFAIAQVDLGFPNPRADTSTIPDRDGEWDDTAWAGPRAVSISGSIVPSTKLGSRSKVLDALAPFLVAGARPTLTYQIDADVAPRTLTLRATALSAPATTPTVSAFQAGWTAPDPAAYSTAANQVTLAPSTLQWGRVYATPQTATPTATSGWAPPRVYPAIVGGIGVVAANHGTLNTQPVIAITGPCTNPAVFNDTLGAVFAVGSNALTFSLAATDTVTIDGRSRTVYLGSDPNNSRYNYVDFTRSSWWPLIPGNNSLRLVCDSADPSAKAVVTWSDAYL